MTLQTFGLGLHRFTGITGPAADAVSKHITLHSVSQIIRARMEELNHSLSHPDVNAKLKSYQAMTKRHMGEIKL